VALTLRLAAGSFCEGMMEALLLWTQEWRQAMGAEAEPCRLGQVFFLACFLLNPLAAYIGCLHIFLSKTWTIPEGNVI
jgi:hypothetical protein